MSGGIESVNVLGVKVGAVNLKSAAAAILRWIAEDTRTHVCITGVHGIIESQSDEELKRIHNCAGMCVPDGMPTVWVGKARGHKIMEKIGGRYLMLEVLEESVARGHSHFFYGGAEGVADQLAENMAARFPGLKVAGTYCPPFRPLTDSEEAGLADIVNKAAPDVVWVGLSTPKQEKWMGAHIGKLDTKVMVGVGAAFDFLTGSIPEAPNWIQQAGLEWLYRLLSEPRRLWRRYFYIVPAFLWLITLQMTGIRKFPVD